MNYYLPVFKVKYSDKYRMVQIGYVRIILSYFNYCLKIHYTCELYSCILSKFSL